MPARFILDPLLPHNFLDMCTKAAAATIKQCVYNALRECPGKRQLLLNENTLRRVIEEELQAVH